MKNVLKKSLIKSYKDSNLYKVETRNIKRETGNKILDIFQAEIIGLAVIHYKSNDCIKHAIISIESKETGLGWLLS